MVKNDNPWAGNRLRASASPAGLLYGGIYQQWYFVISGRALAGAESSADVKGARAPAAGKPARRVGKKDQRQHAGVSKLRQVGRRGRPRPARVRMEDGQQFQPGGFDGLEGGQLG